MTAVPQQPPRRGLEVQEVLVATRAGRPFLVHRDAEGSQVLTTLDRKPLLTVGRDAACDLALSWDDSVSRTHALLERLGRTWTLVDDGISRNGSSVNGQRITARVRLHDGDALRFGETLVTFHEPAGGSAVDATRTQEPLLSAPVTPMQRKVLLALCRPMLESGNRYASPAPNAQIAEELVLSVDAVKTHLRGLFERFAVGDLPQNQKRAKVAEVALRAGLVSERDL
jgi:pSer/pThr/pTyr-binding forkhead associated (FHA) protein